MKNFARVFAHLVTARRRPKPEPLEVRRSNVNRRIVEVSYKPASHLTWVDAASKAWNRLDDLASHPRKRRPGTLSLSRPAARRPYLHTERVLVESAAAITR